MYVHVYTCTHTWNRKDGRVFLLYASSPEEREDWVDALEVPFMYVCMYVNVFFYACTGAYNTYIDAYMYVCLILLHASSPEEREDWVDALEVPCMYVCMYVHMYFYACTHIIHTCIRVCIILLYASSPEEREDLVDALQVPCMYVCMCVCMCICIFMRVHTHITHSYIHTYMCA